MKCEEIRKLLPTYQDGGLSQPKAEEVRVHLVGCRSCQREEQLLSATWEMLDVLPKIEPSPDFRTRLWEKINKEKTKSVRWYHRPQLVFAAGFLGLWVFGVGLGSFLFFKTGQLQKFNFALQRGEALTEIEPPAVNSVYLKRWGGSLL